MLRKSLSVEQRVAVTLWYLATPTEYRTIPHLFGIARSTVCEIVHETCHCIVDVLMKDYIKFPYAGRLDRVVDEFKIKWGVPHCFGAVDGVIQYQLQAICTLITTTVRGGTLC